MTQDEASTFFERVYARSGWKLSDNGWGPPDKSGPERYRYLEFQRWNERMEIVIDPPIDGHIRISQSMGFIYPWGAYWGNAYAVEVLWYDFIYLFPEGSAFREIPNIIF
jgi:hypothetical protein